MTKNGTEYVVLAAKLAGELPQAVIADNGLRRAHLRCTRDEDQEVIVAVECRAPPSRLPLTMTGDTGHTFRLLDGSGSQGRSPRCRGRQLPRVGSIGGA